MFWKKKVTSWISACTSCVYFSQLKWSYKRKYNYMIHLLAASKECVSLQSCCTPFPGFWIPFSGVTHFRQEILIRLFVSLSAAKRIYIRKQDCSFLICLSQTCYCRWIPRGPLKVSYSLEMNELTPPSPPHSLSLKQTSSQENKGTPFQRLSK